MNLIEVQLVTIDDEHYILSNDSNSELFVFSIDNQLTVAYFDELLGDAIQWAKPVLIEPNAIGWVNEGVNDEGLYTLTLLNDSHLDRIRLNNGVCRIEVDDINTELIEDFDPLIHMSYTPILHKSKVIIHL
jgi:hypothetical protein